MSDTKLWEALELLRRDGWYKGPAMGKAKCTAVACYMAGAQRDFAVVRAVVMEQFPDRGNGSIVDFNDHPDTTFEDIELVLTKAAIRRDEAVA